MSQRIPSYLGRPAAASCTLSLSLLVGACAEPNQAPKTTSSVDNPAYAVQHPQELAYLNQRLAAERSSAQQGFEKFHDFPPPLGDTDWKTVEDLYEAADEEGAAEAYAEAQREAAVVQRFFAEEQNALVGRVASSVQYAAKEKSCDVQLAGPAQRGLERGIDKQLEERRRRTSQVQGQIDVQEKALGPKVAERLRDQVDQISFASYMVRVAIATDEQRLRQLQDEANTVKSTLEDEKRRLADAGNTDPKRQRAIDAALKQLTVESTRAQEQLNGNEERNRKLLNDYEAAFNSLIDDVRARAEKSAAQAKN